MAKTRHIYNSRRRSTETITLSSQEFIVTLLLLTGSITMATGGTIRNDYWELRRQFIETEANQTLGSDLILTPDEQKLNADLMRLKTAEIDLGNHDPSTFLPAQHFFTARDAIRESPVFKIIQQLPKGGLLHTHDTAMSSFDVLYDMTLHDNLFGKVDTSNGRLDLMFSRTAPASDWTLVSELRANNASFDQYLRDQLTLVVDNPRERYGNINEVWSTFSQIFGTATPLITYKPVFVEYYERTLAELYEDNVMYLEFRGTLPPVYDLDGNICTPGEIVQLYKDATEKFKATHEGFLGVGFIYAPMRRVDVNTVEEYVRIAEDLLRDHSDFVMGFDLVGQEDLGEPLTKFIEQLQVFKPDVRFFFHAGETNWYGTTDENLVDALLLGTHRIGHGYAITKHPEVQRLVKERDIAVEVCPVSNQVLMLVEDLRNHPAATLIANGFPVVICNDDPTYWGAKGLSYDWYLAFMAFTNRNADLRVLKKLAMNSLQYSAMPESEKNAALAKWSASWNNAIRNMSISDIRLEKV